MKRVALSIKAQLGWAGFVFLSSVGLFMFNFNLGMNFFFLTFVNPNLNYPRKIGGGDGVYRNRTLSMCIGICKSSQLHSTLLVSRDEIGLVRLVFLPLFGLNQSNQFLNCVDQHRLYF